MIKRLLPFFFFVSFILLAVSPVVSRAQSGCPNADFSMGDFTNWVGYTGTYTSCCPTQGIVNGRHTIISTPGTDPNTNNQLQMLPPGATIGARLGNDGTGAQAERLRYTINVSNQNNLFVYKYAVVLEDPDHDASEQPKFNIRVLNAAGNLIDPVCGFYSVVSSSSIPGFQEAPGSVMWKNWTTVGIDLSAFMGQNITVEYTTYDCAQSGHYGYAYLSCSCAPMEISVGYCQGSNNVIMEAPAGFASYAWSPGGYTTQTVTLNNPPLGQTYTCVVTSHNGCQATLSAVIQPTVISPDFTITSPLCSFDVSLQDGSTVNQGTIDEWQWSFGDGSTSTQQNPTHTYSSPGTYTITLIAGSAGCTSTTTQTISVFPAPVANAGSNQIICTGQAANLTATGGITYAWSNGSSSPNNNVSPAITTTYYVTVYDNNQCTATDSVLVTVNPLPVAIAGSDIEICFGTSTPLNATGGNSYLWSPSAGLSNSTISNPVAAPLTSTIYQVTVTDGNGCTNSDDIAIQILPLPPADAGSDIPICINDQASLDASGGVSYLWNTGDTIQPFSVAPQITTTYTVTVTDGNGCSDTDDVIVIVNNPPPAYAGSDVNICFGQTTGLDGSGGVDYLWSPSTGLSNHTLQNPTASPTVGTTYTVLVTDASGCTATDDVFVGIFPAPAIDFEADLYSGCEPLSVNFTDNTTPAIQTWFWDFGDMNSGANNNDTQQNTSHIFVDPGTYTVTLTVTTTDGCTDSYAYTDMIIVHPNPIADFTLSPQIGNLENPIISFHDQSFLAYNWNWDFGESVSGTSNVSTESSPNHMYLDDGEYIITLIVETAEGCTDTTYKTVTIKPDFTFYIPNVFTPDGDGLNDYFQGFGTNIAEYEMYIFNRWGELLFETNDYNEPWNGNSIKNNEPHIQDVYVYKILIKDINQKVHKYYGHITLLR